MLSWLGAFLSNIEVEHAAIGLLVACVAAWIGSFHRKQKTVINEINVKVNGQLTRLRAALERAIAMLPEDKALAAIDPPDDVPEAPAGDA